MIEWYTFLVKQPFFFVAKLVFGHESAMQQKSWILQQLEM
jgi:hypothetical protein